MKSCHWPREVKANQSHCTAEVSHRGLKNVDL
jgi:hypothetical protein